MYIPYIEDMILVLWPGQVHANQTELWLAAHTCFVCYVDSHCEGIRFFGVLRLCSVFTFNWDTNMHGNLELFQVSFSKHDWRIMSSLTEISFFFPAPRFDPDVKKIELSYHEVTLYWDPYPTDEIHPGFLRGYHVYVSPVQEGCNLKGSKKHVLEGKILKFMRIMRLILQPLGKVILGQQIDPLRMA